MSHARKLVCLVTPGHLTSTPRLLKEAQSLAGAGYSIHLVSVDNFPPNTLLDRAILDETGWPATQLTRTVGSRAFVRKLVNRIACRLASVSRLQSVTLLARAQHVEAARLARASAAVPADYYIGHCVASLPAVAHAARRRGAAFGFDLEDYHEAETPGIAANPSLIAITRSLLRTFLSHARHLTAASPLIAEAFATNYGVTPVVVRNVFPLDHAPAAPIDPGPATETHPAVLYWVSQVIGAQRGIESVVTAMARMSTPMELHLRGHVIPSFATALKAHARAVGLQRPIRFLPFSPSREMVRLAAGAHLGLSCEENTPLNRTMCLANKVFVYLLAGVPQIMTDTRAHLALASEIGDAGIIFNLADPDRTAALVDHYFAMPDRAAAARRYSWTLGQTRFNWEREQENFLRAVRAAVGGTRR